MNQRRCGRVVAAAVTVVLRHRRAPAQAPAPDSAVGWTPATSDGQPDLQGTWVNFDTTPFEAVPRAPPGRPPA